MPNNMLTALGENEFMFGGFLVQKSKNLILLTAEWPDSEYMLEINISDMYNEVCRRLSVGNEMVDVFLSHTHKALHIGFFWNIKNKTGFEVVEDFNWFHRVHGSGNFLINASVWTEMRKQGFTAILHANKDPASTYFDLSKNSTMIWKTVMVIALSVLLSVSVWYAYINGVTASQLGTSIGRQYGMFAMYASGTGGPFPTNKEESTSDYGWFN